MMQPRLREVAARQSASKLCSDGTSVRKPDASENRTDEGAMINEGGWSSSCSCAHACEDQEDADPISSSTSPCAACAGSSVFFQRGTAPTCSDSGSRKRRR